MTRILAAVALVAGLFVAAGCHTTNATTLCREHVASRNDYVGYNKWSLVDATKLDADRARCLIRNNQTFQTEVDCISFDDHGYVTCN